MSGVDQTEMPMITRTAILSSLLLILAVHLAIADGVPPKVTGVSVSKAVNKGKITLRVTWTALQNVTNLTEYQVDHRRNGTLSWGHRVSAQPYSTSTLLPDLLPGTEYNVRVRAVFEAGEGEWSEVHTETTFDISPKVTGVSVSKAVKDGNPSLRVTWTALQNVTNLSEYHVEYRLNGQSNWDDTVNAQPNSTSTLLPDLLPGTEYNVRVRAVFEAGEGGWSEVHTETTFDIPSRVMNVSVTKSVEDGNFTLNVSWATPKSESHITQYEVVYRTSGTGSWSNSTRLSVSSPANSTLLTGVDAGVEYIIRVKALSEIGAGAWSEEYRVRAADSPSRVTGVSVTKSVEDGTLYLSSSVFATEDGTCNGFGNCRQPNETTTTPTPVPAAPPLAAIVGAIVAVGVVLLVLLIIGAVPLVMCLMRRQERTKGEILDDDACAQDTDDNAVPTSLDYYDTQEGFEMTTQRTSTDSLPEAQRSDPEYDYTSTTVQQFPVLESHYDLEEGLYWEPATSLHGIKAQINQKAKDSIELDPGSITLQESLGEGEFGTVYKGVWASSPQGPLQVAVKTLHSQEKENKLKLLKEAAIMGQFSHPNVVRLYGVIDKPGKVMLIMEYLSEGDLRNHLMNYRLPTAHKTLSLTLLRFCQEIADAMDYLSKKGFIHRDLAARNILLSEQYIAKIADFGMSHDLDEDHYYKSKGGMIPVKWTAPESVLYKKYSTKSDVWSYGMVMYEIWSLGCKPFEEFDINSVLRAFETGYCQPPPPGCPRNIYKLMVDCWNPDNHARPTFEDITMDLARDPVVLLSWSQQDRETSSKAAVLGAPREEGRHLYPDLQNKY